MVKYSKVNISMPTELLELIDLYAEYNGMPRSSAIGFILAKGLCAESAKTNGFDFDSPFIYEITDNGEMVVLKRSDLSINKAVEWTMLAGCNRRRENVIVRSKDFEVSEVDADMDASKVK